MNRDPATASAAHRVLLGAALALAALPAARIAAQPPTVATLAPMIEQIAPAVVNISVRGHVDAFSPLADEDALRRFFGAPPPRDREFQSAGSGVIVDAANGYILTNYHVLENAEEITVALRDNRVMTARILGSDLPSDIAVLQIDSADLTEIRLGDSSVLRVGDFVVAIGNPFGFGHTVTSGIVSGLGRNRVNPDPEAREDFIQTDAAINPGNSGGALVNLSGELVGINSAIVSGTGGNMGIGFAIPMTIALNVMEQLLSYGEVSRGQLGVVIAELTPDVARLLGLSDIGGALVMDVMPGSAAASAGLRIEDVIVSVDGRPVRDSGALRNLIGLARPGAEVNVGFVRDGETRNVRATLNGSPTPAKAQSTPIESVLDPVFEGVELLAGEASDGTEGLHIARVAADSLAAERGLRVDDIVTHVNRQRVRTVAEADRLTANAHSVLLQVERETRSVLVLLR